MSAARGAPIKNPVYLILFGVPVVYFSTGLIEMIAGVPVDCLKEKWGSLPGWKREALGALIVILSMAVIFAVVTLALAARGY